nr:pectate lyase [Coralloluteibacterium stylophorae]
MYQRRDGGWIENRDPLRVLGTDEMAALEAENEASGGSFDNRNVYTQVEYLAAAWARSGDARHRDGARRGLDFILAHQLDGCGGWPHTVPARASYHPHLTIADAVTPGVLGTLRRLVAADADAGLLDAATRSRVQRAIARGDACLLRLQVMQDGVRTGWAGQYDASTLVPAQGRAFELPALVSDESVAVLRYLMSIRDPSPEVVAAVEAGIAWLERSALHGLRLETVPAPEVRYAFHISRTDRRLVADATAPPLWARFYDLADNTPLLATREGRRVARYADIPRERRTGYDWYGSWPQAFLDEEVPAWRRRLAR